MTLNQLIAEATAKGLNFDEEIKVALRTYTQAYPVTYQISIINIQDDCSNLRMTVSAPEGVVAYAKEHAKY